MKKYYSRFHACFAISFILLGCAGKPLSFSGSNSDVTGERVVDAAGVKYIDSCGGTAPNVAAGTQTVIIWTRPGDSPGGAASNVTQPGEGLRVSPQSAICKVNYKILEHNGTAQASLWVQEGRTRSGAVACNGAWEGRAGIKVMFCPYVTSRDAASQPNSGCTPVDELYVGSDAPYELNCN